MKLFVYGLTIRINLTSVFELLFGGGSTALDTFILSEAHDWRRFFTTVHRKNMVDLYFYSWAKLRATLTPYSLCFEG